MYKYAKIIAIKIDLLRGDRQHWTVRNPRYSFLRTMSTDSTWPPATFIPSHGVFYTLSPFVRYKFTHVLYGTYIDLHYINTYYIGDGLINRKMALIYKGIALFFCWACVVVHVVQAQGPKTQIELKMHKQILQTLVGGNNDLLILLLLLYLFFFNVSCTYEGTKFILLSKTSQYNAKVMLYTRLSETVPLIQQQL